MPGRKTLTRAYPRQIRDSNHVSTILVKGLQCRLQVRNCTQNKINMYHMDFLKAEIIKSLERKAAKY